MRAHHLVDHWVFHWVDLRVESRAFLMAATKAHPRADRRVASSVGLKDYHWAATWASCSVEWWGQTWVDEKAAAKAAH